MHEMNDEEISANITEKWQAPELKIIDVLERTLAGPGPTSDGIGTAS